MLKSLAIGLLTLTAACSTAAFAHDDGGSWNWWNQGGGSSCSWFRPWTCWDHHHHHDHPGGGSVNAAPEIDPAGAMAALSLLAGGLAVMRGRRSGRK